jgi:hypothetical protein
MKGLAICLGLFLTGCAIPMSRVPFSGAIVNVREPVGATNDYCLGNIEHKSARAYSIFGLVAWGDASIERARTVEPSGFMLSRLGTVSLHRRYILGIGISETVVCGLFVRSDPASDQGKVLAQMERTNGNLTERGQASWTNRGSSGF